MAGTFLQRSRHGTVFYFRRRVPNDLRAIVGRPYLVKSLATEQRRDAIIRARALASKTDALFNEWRRVANSTDVIRTDFSEEWLTEFEINGIKIKVASKISDVQPGEEGAAATYANQTRTQAISDAITSAIGNHQIDPPVVERLFGMTFADALKYYLDHVEVKVSSKNVYRTRLQHAQGHFGCDTDIRYLEQADLQGYKKHTLKSVENYWSQCHCIRQMVTFLNFMRDAQTWGNPLTTKNLIPKKKTPDSDDRDAFTIDQLLAVFQNAKKYRQKAPAKYWATIAVAFIGCRVTELAQINLATDLFQDIESGVWFINLAETPDEDDEILRQSMKNHSSWRKVPIHSALVRHGFIDYLHKQLADDLSRPFEKTWKVFELKEPKATPEQSLSDEDVHYHWGKRAVNWASLEMKKLREAGIVEDPKKKLSYFHSMRHTFSGAMADAGVPIDVREAAMGHKYGGPDAERYAKIKQKPVMMSKLAYEPGLVKIAELLDRLWEESSPEAAQGALQSI